jgi:hypothetical protein
VKGEARIGHERHFGLLELGNPGGILIPAMVDVDVGVDVGVNVVMAPVCTGPGVTSRTSDPRIWPRPRAPPPRTHAGCARREGRNHPSEQQITPGCWPNLPA